MAVDYLYEQAARRAMGASHDYDTARAEFYGGDAGPSPAPSAPSRSADVLAEFERRLAASQLNSQHPRNYGYFTPPPLLMSIAGEVLAQVTNQGVDVWHAGPTGAFVEEEVVRWLAELVGYGPDSFGLLTSGGVMANFMAMALARDIHLPKVCGLDRPPRGRDLEGVRVYASDQTHFSIARALDELGFPHDTLVVIAADELFRLRGAPVAEAIASDRAAGLTPLAISAVAGSTNTGAVDALPELADVAEREGLWLHVDAAYGGAARLSAKLAGRVPDLHRAHSVTVDPHKWFFQAYDIGGLLVRDGSHLGQTFGGRRPEYYRDAEGTGRRRPRRGRRPAQLLQARLRGHAPVAGTEAVAVVEAPRHRRVGAARRDDRRSRRAPVPALRRGRRLRGAAGGRGAVRRVFPPPARRPGRRAPDAVGGARRPPGPAPGRARGVG